MPHKSHVQKRAHTLDAVQRLRSGISQLVVAEGWKVEGEGQLLDFLRRVKKLREALLRRAARARSLGCATDDLKHDVAVSAFQCGFMVDKLAQHLLINPRPNQGGLWTDSKFHKRLDTYARAAYWISIKLDPDGESALCARHGLGVLVQRRAGRRYAPAAFAYFQQAAEKGHVRSQLKLAQIYLDGVVTPPSCADQPELRFDLARKWANHVRNNPKATEEDSQAAVEMRSTIAVRAAAVRPSGVYEQRDAGAPVAALG